LYNFSSRGDKMTLAGILVKTMVALCGIGIAMEGAEVPEWVLPVEMLVTTVIVMKIAVLWDVLCVEGILKSQATSRCPKTTVQQSDCPEYDDWYQEMWGREIVERRLAPHQRLFVRWNEQCGCGRCGQRARLCESEGCVGSPEFRRHKQTAVSATTAAAQSEEIALDMLFYFFFCQQALGV
jgi:hypothetical protein